MTKKRQAIANTSSTVPSKQENDTTRFLNLTRKKAYKFDIDAQMRAATCYAQTGSITASALAAGVCCQTIYDYMKDDEDFTELWEAAKQHWRDHLESIAYKVAFEGVEEPMLGGKDRDQIVAYKKLFQPRIMELMLKKYDPQMRDKSQVDFNVQGGVLVVGAQLSEEEFEKEYGGKQLPPPIDAEVIDV